MDLFKNVFKASETGSKVVEIITPVRSVGGEVDAIVETLLEATVDKDKNVRDEVVSALVDIGKKQTMLVVSATLNYVQTKHKKMQVPQITLLHEILNLVLQQSASKVFESQDEAFINELINMFIFDMCKDAVKDIQSFSFSSLLLLGAVDLRLVMDQLLARFQSGVLPQPYIIKAIGALAAQHGSGFIPFLRDVFARLLPILGLAKTDTARETIALAMNGFAEAILSHRASQGREGSDDFCAECSTVFDMVMSNWLIASNKTSVKLAALDAIAQMSSIVSPDQLDKALPKLIPMLLAYYKDKDVDKLLVSRSLCNVLAPATESCGRVVIEFVEMLLSALHPQVCAPPDYTQPSAVANYHEAHRGFEILGRSFTDQVIAFLFTKLESRDSSVKVGTLALLKHLVSRLDDELSPRKDIVVAGMCSLLQETDSRVQVSIAQMVIAMAPRGYLACVGGQSLLLFVVALCCKTDGKSVNVSTNTNLFSSSSSSAAAAAPPSTPAALPSTPSSASDPSSSASLCSIGEQILDLLTSTTSVESVLWPFLLEPLMDPQYINAFPVLIKTLLQVATQINASNPSLLTSVQLGSGDLPRGVPLFARLLVPLSLPAHKGQGMRILELLEIISPVIHPALSESMPRCIRKMMGALSDFLEKEEELGVWNDIMNQFVSKISDLVGTIEWRVELADALSQQLSSEPMLYPSVPERVALYNILGNVLIAAAHKELTRRSLDGMLKAIERSASSDEERTACALAVGGVAQVHVDLVYSKLQDVVTTLRFPSPAADPKPKIPVMSAVSAPKWNAAAFLGNVGGAMVGLGKAGAGLVGKVAELPGTVKEDKTRDRADECVSPSDRLKATVILAYGFAARAAPVNVVASRLEVHVTDSVLPLIMEANALYLQRSAVDAVQVMAATVYEANMTKGMAAFRLKQRDQLIVCVLKHLHSRPPPMTQSADPILRLWAHGLQTLAQLLKLEPPVALEIEQDVISALSAILDVVLTVPDDAEESCASQEALEAARVLVVALMEVRRDIGTMLQLIDTIRPYLDTSLKGKQRAMALVCQIIQTLHANSKTATTTTTTTNGNKASSSNCIPSDLSEVLATVSLRCVDDVGIVRKLALTAVQSLLMLAGDDRKADFAVIAEKLMDDNYDHRLKAMPELATLLSQNLEGTSVALLLEWLLRGCNDKDPRVSRAACVMCQHLTVKRIGDLQDCAGRLLHVMVGPISLSERDSQSRESLVIAATAITSNHFTAVLDQILSVEAFSFDDAYGKTLECICKDDKICGQIIDHVTSRISEIPPAPTPNPKSKSFSKEAILAANTAVEPTIKSVCCLDVVISYDACCRYTRANHSKLITGILLALAVYIEYPNPSQAASFRKVLQRLLCLTTDPESNSTVESLQASGSWEGLLNPASFREAAVQVVVSVCAAQPSSLCTIFEQLYPLASRQQSSDHIAFVIAIFSQLILLCNNEGVLVQALLEVLQAAAASTDDQVRPIAFVGLGNIANLNQQLKKHVAPVVSALVGGIEDGCEEGALEALRSLTLVLNSSDKVDVAPMLTNLAARIPTAFERNEASVRAAAVNLFGCLGRFSSDYVQDSVKEQVHAVFPTLLLLVNESEQPVRAASKRCLRSLSVLLGSSLLTAVFAAESFDEQRKLDYEEFGGQVSTVIVKDMADRVDGVVHSLTERLGKEKETHRCNAALLLGFLINCGYEQRGSRHDIGAAVKALKTALKKDTSPKVRSNCARALSFLYML